jgi:hypothetical protein
MWGFFCLVRKTIIGLPIPPYIFIYAKIKKIYFFLILAKIIVLSTILIFYKGLRRNDKSTLNIFAFLFVLLNYLFVLLQNRILTCQTK